MGRVALSRKSSRARHRSVLQSPPWPSLHCTPLTHHRATGEQCPAHKGSEAPGTQLPRELDKVSALLQLQALLVLSTAWRSRVIMHSEHGVTLLERGSSEHGMSVVTSLGTGETLLSVHCLQTSAASENSSSVLCVQRCHWFLLNCTQAVPAAA